MDRDLEMQRALEADGEKLRQMTGEDYGPWTLDEYFELQAPCPHCFESSGYEARVNPATWTDPAWADADPTRPCPYCQGNGYVAANPIDMTDLAEMAGDDE